MRAPCDEIMAALTPVTPVVDDMIELCSRGVLRQRECWMEVQPQGCDWHPWIAGGAQDTQGFHRVGL